MQTELCTGESTEVGTEGGDKCVDNVDKLRKKWCGGEKGRIRKRSATSGGGNAGRATLS